jgi:hypothetical protein
LSKTAITTLPIHSRISNQTSPEGSIQITHNIPHNANKKRHKKIPSKEEEKVQKFGVFVVKSDQTALPILKMCVPFLAFMTEGKNRKKTDTKNLIIQNSRVHPTKKRGKITQTEQKKKKSKTNHILASCGQQIIILSSSFSKI